MLSVEVVFLKITVADYGLSYPVAIFTEANPASTSLEDLLGSYNLTTTDSRYQRRGISQTAHV